MKKLQHYLLNFSLRYHISHRDKKHVILLHGARVGNLSTWYCPGVVIRNAFRINFSMKMGTNGRNPAPTDFSQSRIPKPQSEPGFWIVTPVLLSLRLESNKCFRVHHRTSAHALLLSGTGVLCECSRILVQFNITTEVRFVPLVHSVPGSTFQMVKYLAGDWSASHHHHHALALNWLVHKL